MTELQLCCDAKSALKLLCEFVFTPVAIQHQNKRTQIKTKSHVSCILLHPTFVTSTAVSNLKASVLSGPPRSPSVSYHTNMYLMILRTGLVELVKIVIALLKFIFQHKYFSMYSRSRFATSRSSIYWQGGPASSADSEYTVSYAGRVIVARRNHLETETVDSILFLYSARLLLI